jgi:tetratricopeptide (TPR) repeat protein
LDPDKRAALLEHFEETRGFPGQPRPASWEQEKTDHTASLPAIHQFIALEALRNATDSLRSIFVHRARERFAAWFARERLVSPEESPARAAYAMGPVTAALILTVQEESGQEAARAPSAARQILNLGHRLKIRKTDLRIVSTVLLAMLLVHLLYNLPRRHDIEARIADAALYYQQGRYTEAMQICRRYPHTARSLLLQANMMMLAERPDQAEPLYRQALKKDTESASALFGLALALQLNGEFKQAEKRYIDFIDLYETRWPEAANLADEFIRLSRAQFKSPPRWKQVFALPMMKDLRL